MAESSVVLVTGGNAGLGYQIVKALYSSTKPHSIFLCGRSLQKAQDAVTQLQKEVVSSEGLVKALQVDITDDKSIEAAAEAVRLQYGRLDALVNNAGAWLDNHVHDGSMSVREVWSKSFDVNVVGAHQMTHAFAPLLIKSTAGRVTFTTSDTASLMESENPDSPFALDKPYPAGWPKPPTTPFTAYRCSKVGTNMLMREWRKALVNDRVLVFCVSPGFMATNLGGKAEALKATGGGDPAVSGDFVRRVVEGEYDGNEGKAFRADGVQPW